MKAYVHGHLYYYYIKMACISKFYCTKNNLATCYFLTLISMANYLYDSFLIYWHNLFRKNYKIVKRNLKVVKPLFKKYYNYKMFSGHPLCELWLTSKCSQLECVQNLSKIIVFKQY